MIGKEGFTPIIMFVKWQYIGTNYIGMRGGVKGMFPL